MIAPSYVQAPAFQPRSLADGALLMWRQFLPLEVPRARALLRMIGQEGPVARIAPSSDTGRRRHRHSRHTAAIHPSLWMGYGQSPLAKHRAGSKLTNGTKRGGRSTKLCLPALARRPE